MGIEVEPVEGNWYQFQERGQKFEVLDIDEEGGIVEIQFLDGDIDEVDLDEWYDLDIVEIDDPEEWDEEESEDYVYSDEEDDDEEEEAEDWDDDEHWKKDN